MTTTQQMITTELNTQASTAGVNGIVLSNKNKKLIKNANALAKAQAKAQLKAQLKAEKEKENLEAWAVSDHMKQLGDELAEKDKTYHEHYVKNSNAALYKLLEEIMALAEEVLASEHEKVIISSMRRKMKFSLRINTQANTPSASIVVRYVIRTSRKNACVYARVIEKAIKDGIKSSGLSAYIANNQGIDNIRKAAVAEGKAAKQATNPQEIDEENVKKKRKYLINFGDRYLKNRVGTGISTFKIDTKYSGHLTDLTRHGEYKYFACEYINSEYVVIDAVPMDYEFETQLLERIAGYALEKSVFSQDEADAMQAAAKECNITLKRKLYVTNRT